MAREEVAEVSYCYYSRDSREIVRKFPCLEAAKFTDRDRTFWDVLPAARADVFGHCARQRVNRHPILQLYNRYTGDSPLTTEVAISDPEVEGAEGFGGDDFSTFLHVGEHAL